MPPVPKKIKASDHAAVSTGSSGTVVLGAPRMPGDPTSCGSGHGTTVCAIVENRAREACIAVIETDHASVLKAS